MNGFYIATQKSLGVSLAATSSYYIHKLVITPFIEYSVQRTHTRYTFDRYDNILAYIHTHTHTQSPIDTNNGRPDTHHQPRPQHHAGAYPRPFHNVWAHRRGRATHGRGCQEGIVGACPYG